ncbi:MAG TPA: hypothetical protein VK196_12720 [Magnetospirillum sp.]|nr:hypothetical protein [Magnetospirillum sp.]
MKIGSVGAFPQASAIVAPARNEGAERGPERDNDSDDAVAATKALPTPPAGRGTKVDILA